MCLLPADVFLLLLLMSFFLQLSSCNGVSTPLLLGAYSFTNS